MAEYYQIQIGPYFLTKDGTVQAAGIGERCALEVDGIPELQSPFLITRVNDFRGNPIITKNRVGQAGRDLTVRILGKADPGVIDSIVDLHNSAHENDTVIRLIGNDTVAPDFDLFALPDAGHFTRDPGLTVDGFYQGVVLKYVCVGEASLAWGGDTLAWGSDNLIWNWS